MSPRVRRDALVRHLDDYLDVAAWPDKSMNGLQVEGAAEVERIGIATDAARATFELAEAAGVQFLIVHHGLFWGSPIAVTGIHRDRIAALLDARMSLYAAHLPLDAHPEVGNNAVLARLLGLAEREPFGRAGDRTIGFAGRLEPPIDRDALAARLEALLGVPPLVLPFGAGEARRVGIVSGAAADLIPAAAAAGLDAFVTGETSHTAWHVAREHRLDVLFAGHYATETLGVQALGDHLAERFELETVFLDAPTGL